MLSLVTIDTTPSDPFATPSAASAIETRFPRIARELAGVWHTPASEAYLSQLLIHNRGDRDGFPPEVQQELMFLSDLLWHLNHPTGLPSVHSRTATFSFSAANEMELRYASRRGAWVL